MTYKPPFTVTSKILSLVSEISESVGRLSVINEQDQALRLRRVNKLRTIQGSLAIEGNTLSVEQITAVFEGKPALRSFIALKCFTIQNVVILTQG